MKFNSTTLKRYLSPHAYKDLDVFVEQLPMRAGQGIIVAGIAAWVAAGLAVTYVAMQANHVMALRADILKAEALKPTVPVIAKTPVPFAEVDAFAKKLSDLYPQLQVRGTDGRIEFSGQMTDKYGAFREAVGHAFNGGKGWRVATESMCVGRECKNGALQGAFTVYRLQVDKAGG